MSDFHEPIRGEICDPETLREFCEMTFVPLAHRLYGGDFFDSVVGDRAASLVIRGGFKIYFEAVCELYGVMEDGECVVYPTQTIYIHIGMLVVNEAVRQHLIDVHSIAKLDSMLDEILTTADTEGDDIPLASDLDADDDIDYVNTRAWSYLRLVIDCVDGGLHESTRYYALDTYDDDEIIREPIVLCIDESDEDGVEEEDVITEEEFDRLKFASQFIGQ